MSVRQNHFVQIDRDVGGDLQYAKLVRAGYSHVSQALDCQVAGDDWEGTGQRDGAGNRRVETAGTLVKVDRIGPGIGVGLGNRPAQRAGVEVVVQVGDVVR